MPTTTDAPKCFAEVAGKRILDWTVDVLQQKGVRQIAFIGGYRIEKVRVEYPEFTMRHNAEWERNNILSSLFCAEDLMDEPFVCCYSDVLFTGKIVGDLLGSEADISLAIDTQWLARYAHRSDHPTGDAEKVTVPDGLVTRVDRRISEEDAYGEFIGLAKFSAAGASAMRRHFHDCRREFAGRPFREASVFEKAYLIHLLQDMIEAGQPMVHVDTPGGYIEVDTQQDFEYARECWTSRHMHR
jgi:choline kinase